MRRIGDRERRARLVRRHLLDPAARAGSAVDVARALVSLHATDAVTVFLSVHARAEGVAPSRVENELYEERSLVRMLGMRRTLFVVPRELRPVVQAACADDIAARERKRLEGWLAATPGIGDPRRWLAHAERAALETVATLGEAATADVTRRAELLATRVEVGSGRWAVTQSVAARLLPVLAAEGKLVRARPRGSWASGQFRWALAEAWLEGDPPRVDVAVARAELVRAWLSSFGPGTEVDLRWWTGLGARPVREALAAVGPVEVELESGGTGFVLAGDLEAEPEPSAALLPTLDATTMGWKERHWYLDRQGAATLFDTNGNAGPTVWWEGRVVGGWSQRADGEIAVALLEDVGTDARAAVEREAERLQAWLGGVRVRPGFLPPFQRALAS